MEHFSSEEWEKITYNAIAAEKFFKSDICKVMERDLKAAKELVYTNRVHEEREVHVVTALFQRIITIPRKEKLDELVGEIKYIKGIFSDMQGYIDERKNKEKMESEGKIAIDRQTK